MVDPNTASYFVDPATKQLYRYTGTAPANAPPQVVHSQQPAPVVQLTANAPGTQDEVRPTAQPQSSAVVLEQPEKQESAADVKLGVMLNFVLRLR